jgi:hypothetical protein
MPSPTPSPASHKVNAKTSSLTQDIDTNYENALNAIADAREGQTVHKVTLDDL